jgi:hypothetical protein
MTDSPHPPRTLRQRVTFVVVVTVVALLAVALLLPFALGAGFIAALSAPGCGGETIPPMPYEDVSFPSTEFNRPTPAYFILGDPTASGTGATVLVVPTGHAGRGDRMAEIAVYTSAGINVLTYNSRACVGAGAANTLGYKEALQVGDALAYLATRPDVDMNRIGIHGFSAGGASAIMAAANFSAIRAVVAAGGYHDFGAEIDNSAPSRLWFAPFFRLGARFGYRLSTGDDVSVLNPVSVIGQIAPRPILLIYGTNEPGLAGAYLQQQAAGANAELWVVPGATHGSYIFTAPDEYVQRVSDFMTAALTPQ